MCGSYQIVVTKEVKFGTQFYIKRTSPRCHVSHFYLKPFSEGKKKTQKFGKKKKNNKP